MSKTEQGVRHLSRRQNLAVIPAESTRYAARPPVTAGTGGGTRTRAGVTVMLRVFLRAYFLLTKFDFEVTKKDFRRIQEEVLNCPTAPKITPLEVGQICRSLNIACALYPKEVLCLQRSSALTCLLRRCGVSASMLFGAQILPFRAHAWVEVGGQAINERVDVRGEFSILARR